MSRKLKVDMTGVESYTRCPEGQFKAKIIKAEDGTTQGGDDCIKLRFEVLSGSGKGCQVFDTLTLGEKALWKLKTLLEALGLKSDGKIVVDLDKLEGKSCGIEVIHDEYNGTKRAKINQYIKNAMLEDEDDDEDDDDEDYNEKPAKSSKKPTKKAEPEDDEDEEDEEEEEEKPVKKSSKKPAKEEKKPSKKPAKKAEDEDDDEDDWEEDD